MEAIYLFLLWWLYLGIDYFRVKKGSLPNKEELVSKKGLVISINLKP